MVLGTYCIWLAHRLGVCVCALIVVRRWVGRFVCLGSLRRVQRMLLGLRLIGGTVDLLESVSLQVFLYAV